MSMIWDAPLTAAVARELHARLAGSRLRGHSFDWSRRQISLFFRSETLHWYLHPEGGWVTVECAEETSNGFRPLAAELLQVESPPDERILRFRFRKARGRVRSVQVIIELMTNQWNALLAEGEELWIRHLLWTRRSGDRVLEVGRAYRPPESSARMGVDDPLTDEEWRSLTRLTGADEAPESLLGKVAFTSPLNLPSLLGDEPPNSSGARGETGYRLWTRLQSLDPLDPCLLETSSGLQPYPVVLQNFKTSSFPSILEAMERAFEEDSEPCAPNPGSAELLERAMEQARRRAGSIRKEMEKAQDPEKAREKANLLLARLGEVKRGASEVSLRGFQGESVTLSLDPSLTPHENAEALYGEAARQERALKRLPALLEKAEGHLNELTALRDRLEAGEIQPGEVETRLSVDGSRERWRGKGVGPRFPYKRFRSSGGLEILVGRGPGDNDALTFRYARPEDVWLHAREAAGAHVILRWTKDEPPPARDLAEAAGLAALHSGARGSGLVPVDWTRRKYVRKPRKAPAGTVVPARVRTLFVEPDPELLQRLLWKEG